MDTSSPVQSRKIANSSPSSSSSSNSSSSPAAPSSPTSSSFVPFKSPAESSAAPAERKGEPESSDMVLIPGTGKTEKLSRILGDQQFAQELYEKIGVTTAKASSLFEDTDDEWCSTSEKNRRATTKKVPWPPLDEMDIPDRPLLDLLVHNEGFLLDFGHPSAKLSSSVENVIEDAHLDYKHYANDVSRAEHRNWMASTPSGPLSLSVVTQPIKTGLGPKKNLSGFKCLLRSKEGDDRMVILASTFKEVIKSLRQARPELLPVKWNRIKDPSIVAELVNFEAQGIVDKYKFGILYCREGQHDEDEMFSNNDPSPAFEEFLLFLGEKVPLDGWPRFAGGLDTKKGSTGTESLYTSHEGFEIMFHVSTMLPFFPADKQQLERKRHFGNDVVVIIFCEGNSSVFSPLWLASHFNHVFFIVEKNPNFADTHYDLAIAHKPGVRYYSPYIPSPATFQKNADFRHLLLTKLINSERAAMQAPAFCEKLSRTRKMLLTDLMNRMIPNGQQ